ncbi:hypothetical protein SISNIDRAFT_471774 [Sistotremastrum niveocremeum HHB9708]|uniref:Fungal N-terminal domain-containing protein n=1 Tax=Sistotremastrum niveocremeum HHB9708 TaxID=1314777 RepID=A0A164M8D5_9AGAM|nr:hypothetical protein SISNIDRAFT_471774 [Sistotremastrum niveocremeum HHB9708]
MAPYPILICLLLLAFVAGVRNAHNIEFLLCTEAVRVLRRCQASLSKEERMLRDVESCLIHAIRSSFLKNSSDDWRDSAQRLTHIRTAIGKIVQMQTHLLRFENGLEEVKRCRQAFGSGKAVDTEILNIANDVSYLTQCVSDPHSSASAEMYRVELSNYLKDLEGITEASAVGADDPVHHLLQEFGLTAVAHSKSQVHQTQVPSSSQGTFVRTCYRHNRQDSYVSFKQEHYLAVPILSSSAAHPSQGSNTTERAVEEHRHDELSPLVDPNHASSLLHEEPIPGITSEDGLETLPPLAALADSDTDDDDDVDQNDNDEDDLYL